MDSLKRLFSSLLADASRWCDASTIHDRKKAMERIENEGLSFFTITLPNYCQDFERSLANGMVDPSFFLGFKKKGELPLFLGGFLDLVFDRQSGVLLDTPNVNAIYFVRQITLAFKKIVLPCTDSRVAKAYKGYVECEKELKQRAKTPEFRKLRKQFSLFAEALWAPRLAGIDYDVYHHNVLPKHGSGAVAERIRGNSKYVQSEWPTRLERSFPFELYGMVNPSWYNEFDNIQFLEPGAERPVRVITVPKTMKTPRIIGIEPLCMQYAQQGILELLVPNLTLMTKGSLNFRSQEKNRELAFSSSRDGKYATLDLSEASDRVHSSLVWAMLRCAPNLRKAVFASRSTRSDVPGYGVLTLSKFASMGSALCFPIESMVFLTICLMAYTKAKGTRVSEKLIHEFFSEVCIYGDDIIVPVDMTSGVVSELSSFMLKVNKHKSFFTGKFRESCGADVYDGIDVKPVYVRSMPPSRRHDATARVSWVSLANQLYKAGCWESAKTVRDILGFHPIVSEDSSLLGFISYIPNRSVGRWNKDLHRWETKGDVVSIQLPSSKLEGHGALMKFFLKRGEDPIFDSKHLERYGRPDCVRTKSRWASPF